MATLQDGDFELDGYVIGDVHPLNVMDFDPEGPSIRNQDHDSPVGDIRYFGRDQRSGPTWLWEFGASAQERSQAQADAAVAARVWRRTYPKPGEESVLRFRLGGVTRRVYGRARKFDYKPLDRKHNTAGYIPIDALFDCGDSWIYDDEERIMSATLRASSKGGLKTPLKGNLKSLKGGTRNGAITDIGGDAPAPFTATIHGPVKNPSIAYGDWVIELNTTLAYDQSVTIDTRKSTVIRNDGASLAGTLTRASRLNTSRLAPGPANILFSGVDASGTARVEVRWRPTFHST